MFNKQIINKFFINLKQAVVSFWLKIVDLLQKVLAIARTIFDFYAPIILWGLKRSLVILHSSLSRLALRSLEFYAWISVHPVTLDYIKKGELLFWKLAIGLLRFLLRRAFYFRTRYLFFTKRFDRYVLGLQQAAIAIRRAPYGHFSGNERVVTDAWRHADSKEWFSLDSAAGSDNWDYWDHLAIDSYYTSGSAVSTARESDDEGQFAFLPRNRVRTTTLPENDTDIKRSVHEQFSSSWNYLWFSDYASIHRLLAPSTWSIMLPKNVTSTANSFSRFAKKNILADRLFALTFVAYLGGRTEFLRTAYSALALYLTKPLSISAYVSNNTSRLLSLAFAKHGNVPFYPLSNYGRWRFLMYNEFELFEDGASNRRDFMARTAIRQHLGLANLVHPVFREDLEASSLFGSFFEKYSLALGGARTVMLPIAPLRPGQSYLLPSLDFISGRNGLGEFLNYQHGFTSNGYLLRSDRWGRLMYEFGSRAHQRRWSMASGRATYDALRFNKLRTASYDEALYGNTLDMLDVGPANGYLLQYNKFLRRSIGYFPDALDYGASSLDDRMAYARSFRGYAAPDVPRKNLLPDLRDMHPRLYKNLHKQFEGQKNFDKFLGNFLDLSISPDSLVDVRFYAPPRYDDNFYHSTMYMINPMLMHSIDAIYGHHFDVNQYDWFFENFDDVGFDELGLDVDNAVWYLFDAHMPPTCHRGNPVNWIDYDAKNTPYTPFQANMDPLLFQYLGQKWKYEFLQSGEVFDTPRLSSRGRDEELSFYDPLFTHSWGWFVVARSWLFEHLLRNVVLGLPYFILNIATILVYSILLAWHSARVSLMLRKKFLFVWERTIIWGFHIVRIYYYAPEWLHRIWRYLILPTVLFLGVAALAHLLLPALEVLNLFNFLWFNYWWFALGVGLEILRFASRRLKDLPGLEESWVVPWTISTAFIFTSYNSGYGFETERPPFLFHFRKYFQHDNYGLSTILPPLRYQPIGHSAFSLSAPYTQLGSRAKLTAGEKIMLEYGSPFEQFHDSYAHFRHRIHLKNTLYPFHFSTRSTEKFSLLPKDISILNPKKLPTNLFSNVAYWHFGEFVPRAKLLQAKMDLDRAQDATWEYEALELVLQARNAMRISNIGALSNYTRWRLTDYAPFVRKLHGMVAPGVVEPITDSSLDYGLVLLTRRALNEELGRSVPLDARLHLADGNLPENGDNEAPSYFSHLLASFKNNRQFPFHLPVPRTETQLAKLANLEFAWGMGDSAYWKSLVSEANPDLTTNQLAKWRSFLKNFGFGRIKSTLYSFRTGMDCEVVGDSPFLIEQVEDENLTSAFAGAEMHGFFFMSPASIYLRHRMGTHDPYPIFKSQYLVDAWKVMGRRYGRGQNADNLEIYIGQGISVDPIKSFFHDNLLAPLLERPLNYKIPAEQFVTMDVAPRWYQTMWGIDYYGELEHFFNQRYHILPRIHDQRLLGTATLGIMKANNAHHFSSFWFPRVSDLPALEHRAFVEEQAATNHRKLPSTQNTIQTYGHWLTRQSRMDRLLCKDVTPAQSLIQNWAMRRDFRHRLENHRLPSRWSYPGSRYWLSQPHQYLPVVSHRSTYVQPLATAIKGWQVHGRLNNFAEFMPDIFRKAVVEARLAREEQSISTKLPRTKRLPEKRGARRSIKDLTQSEKSTLAGPTYAENELLADGAWTDWGAEELFEDYDEYYIFHDLSQIASMEEDLAEFNLEIDEDDGLDNVFANHEFVFGMADMYDPDDTNLTEDHFLPEIRQDQLNGWFHQDNGRKFWTWSEPAEDIGVMRPLAIYNLRDLYVAPVPEEWYGKLGLDYYWSAESLLTEMHEIPIDTGGEEIIFDNEYTQDVLELDFFCPPGLLADGYLVGPSVGGLDSDFLFDDKGDYQGIMPEMEEPAEPSYSADVLLNRPEQAGFATSWDLIAEAYSPVVEALHENRKPGRTSGEHLERMHQNNFNRGKKPLRTWDYLAQNRSRILPLATSHELDYASRWFRHTPNIFPSSRDHSELFSPAQMRANFRLEDTPVNHYRTISDSVAKMSLTRPYMEMASERMLDKFLPPRRAQVQRRFSYYVPYRRPYGQTLYSEFLPYLYHSKPTKHNSATHYIENYLHYPFNIRMDLHKSFPGELRVKEGIFDILHKQKLIPYSPLPNNNALSMLQRNIKKAELGQTMEKSQFAKEGALPESSIEVLGTMENLYEDFTMKYYAKAFGTLIYQYRGQGQGLRNNSYLSLSPLDQQSSGWFDDYGYLDRSLRWVSRWQAYWEPWLNDVFGYKPRLTGSINNYLHPQEYFYSSISSSLPPRPRFYDNFLATQAIFEWKLGSNSRSSNYYLDDRSRRLTPSSLQDQLLERQWGPEIAKESTERVWEQTGLGKPPAKKKPDYSGQPPEDHFRPFLFPEFSGRDRILRSENWNPYGFLAARFSQKLTTSPGDATRAGQYAIYVKNVGNSSAQASGRRAFLESLVVQKATYPRNLWITGDLSKGLFYGHGKDYLDIQQTLPHLNAGVGFMPELTVDRNHQIENFYPDQPLPVERTNYLRLRLAAMRFERRGLDDSLWGRLLGGHGHFSVLGTKAHRLGHGRIGMIDRLRLGNHWDELVVTGDLDHLYVTGKLLTNNFAAIYMILIYGSYGTKIMDLIAFFSAPVSDEVLNALQGITF